MITPYILGVDSGTSVVKSVIFDLTGTEIAVARRPMPVVNPRPGESEIDMVAAWTATAETITEVVKAVGSEAIAAVGISGTACGFWPIDEQGRPVRQAILWNDGRAADIISEWQTSGLYSRIFAISGNAPFPGYPLSLLRWLDTHEPDTLQRTRWLLFHKDWLRYNLTGDIHVEQADVSYMPGDIRSRGYSETLLELCGLAAYRDRLPPVVHSHDVVGQVTEAAAARVGLRVGTPVVAGAVDVVASALGAGVHQPGQACSILGTSFLNSLAMAQPSFEPPESGAQACLPNDVWLRSLVNTSGTLNIDWLIDNLALPEQKLTESSGRSVFDHIEETISQVPPGAHGLVFHPYLNTSGIVSPFAEPTARAQFFGLSMEHSRADLMRAIYEGVALSMRDCYDSIGQPVEEVILVGGGAQSKLWAQMFADATERRILVTDGTELGARGVAILAGVGAGLYDSLSAAIEATIRIAKTYTPQPGPARAYRAMYELYRHLYLNAREGWQLRRRVLETLNAIVEEDNTNVG
jgi:sugar (pentulose or hexulose) kinase